VSVCLFSEVETRNTPDQSINNYFIDHHNTSIYSLEPWTVDDSGQAPRYLRDLIRLPSSAISLRPLRSLDRHDLFVPRARTPMAQTRAFAIIGHSLWNQLLPSTRSTVLTGEPSASLFSQDCSLPSGSLALEALLIGVHCKKRYIDV